MVMKAHYVWDGPDVSVWDDTIPGSQVPLTSREEARILRAIRRVDERIRNDKRNAALAKFEERCQ
jgi:hypothetical protein